MFGVRQSVFGFVLNSSFVIDSAPILVAEKKICLMFGG